jgi:hypothetical protein
MYNALPAQALAEYQICLPALFAESRIDFGRFLPGPSIALLLGASPLVVSLVLEIMSNGRCCVQIYVMVFIGFGDVAAWPCEGAPFWILRRGKGGAALEGRAGQGTDEKLLAGVSSSFYALQRTSTGGRLPRPRVTTRARLGGSRC